MKAQNTNKIITSTLLFLEHEILNKGSGYYPVSANFYDIRERYTNYKSYSAPYASIVADQSLPGATLMTGVYINNNFVTTGTSGLSYIDYTHGKLYFTGNIAGTISGDFYVKEYEFAITDQEDTTLLFETQHVRRPKYSQATTGISHFENTFPIIYLRFDGGENVPFAFGGTDDSKYYVRGVVLADSKYSLDAVLSIVQDTARKNIPMIDPSNYPFNFFGDYNNGVIYNYTGLTNGLAPDVFIEKSYISKLQQQFLTDLKNVPADVKIGFFDLELSQHRQPRL